MPGRDRKRRPFLVVSADAFNTNDAYAKVMVVHLATRNRGQAFSWEVPLRRGAAGLPLGSVAKCNEVYTLFKEQLGELLGTLPAEDMVRVDGALRVALSL